MNWGLLVEEAQLPLSTAVLAYLIHLYIVMPKQCSCRNPEHLGSDYGVVEPMDRSRDDVDSE